MPEDQGYQSADGIRVVGGQSLVLSRAINDSIPQESGGLDVELGPRALEPWTGWPRHSAHNHRGSATTLGPSPAGLLGGEGGRFSNQIVSGSIPQREDTNREGYGWE